jgi:rubrerythrin
VTETRNRALLLAGWNLGKAVEMAMAVEEMGAARYQALASKWESTEKLRALFSRLAADEVAHGEGVRSLLAGATSRSGSASALDEECLKAIAHDHLFAEDGGALSGIENLAVPQQVLEKILKFENATLHFYRGLRDVLGPSPTLDQMITEEKRHAVEIMRAMHES